ncbi:MAG TPA: hypothetical protein VG826_22785 [Pirellulales bacterium]|nr:hypothetical protein [Pirellulales bacterium]
MKRLAHVNLVRTCSKSVLLVSAIVALGQPRAGSEEPGDLGPAESGSSESAPTEAEKSHLRAAQRHMRGLELRRRDAENETIELIDRPLLSFGDPARQYQRGSFWAWGRTGRPAAFMEVWQNADQPELWRHSITLCSSDRLVLDAGISGRWTPPQAALETRAIADAPPPAKEESARLRQLKELGRRFTAHEFWDPDNSRFELRLLPQPVHRYTDPTARLQDGAVFIVAHGTNPEIVLLIEAQGDSLESSRWHYALVRTSSAELHVSLDGKEIWQRGRVPNIAGSPLESYWIFRLPVESQP